jgi:CheY-like chemotaxis protein
MTSDIRSTQDILEEISSRLGHVPPWLQPAMETPAILESLWQSLCVAHLDNPLPARLREKILLLAARSATVPYPFVSHACALRALGVSGKEILALLQSSLANESLEADLAVLSADRPASWTAANEDVLARAASRAEVRASLRHVLGPRLWPHVVNLLAWAHTSFQWMEAQPDLSCDADPIVRDWRAVLTNEAPQLAAPFHGNHPARDGAFSSLAAGLAHEINDPLAYVVTNLELAAEEIGRHADRSQEWMRDVEQMIDEARNGAERTRRIARSLKTFTPVGEERRVPLDVRQVLDLAIEATASEIRHRARLTLACDPVPLVEADEARLARVLMNLLLDAARDIPEGAAADHELRVSTRVEAGSVIVAVGDAFVTLAIAAASAAPSAARAPTPHPSSTTRRGKVLVVDDDPLVGKSIVRVLRSHDVTVVYGGREAIALLEGPSMQWDVVLCDIMMPDMTGAQLWEHLERTHPDRLSRFVFITAGAFTPSAQAFVQRVRNRRLDKPFSPDVLRAVVADMLG